MSYRHPKTGSVYIQALCKVILADVERKGDFASFLADANEETARMLEKEKCMQCPVFSSTLRKKIMFPEKKRKNPPIAEGEDSDNPTDAEDELSEPFASLTVNSSSEEAEG